MQTFFQLFNTYNYINQDRQALFFFSSWKAEIQGDGDKTNSAVGLQGQK